MAALPRLSPALSLACAFAVGLSGAYVCSTTVWASDGTSNAIAAAASTKTGDAGSTATDAGVAPAASATAKPADDVAARVDALMAEMSDDEKVGQLLFLGFGGKVMDDTIAQFLRQKRPGGVALFGRNIKRLKQTLTLIREVRKHDPKGVPMFVSVDQEGGNVVRIRQGATILPSNMALGAAFDKDLARRAGQSMGWDLAQMGFNMNLAPVLDVNSNPKNPVIGVRSFGSDPKLVADIGVAFIEGMQQEGISAVAKHFPGHGDTASDSHFAMPKLEHDRARLDAMELVPFRAAFDAGLDALMTAHISLPAIAEEADMPATVSKNVLTGILRDDMKYDSIVITDGLEMAGIVDRYGSGEAAVRAVVAGADMVMVLWFPEKKNEVERMLRAAVKSGRITKARLDDAVRHVLTVKVRRGLMERKLKAVTQAMRDLAKSPYRKVVDEVARRAITVVRTDETSLPLLKDNQQRVVVLSSERSFLSSVAHKKASRVAQVRMPLRVSKSRALKLGKQALRRLKGNTVVVVSVRDPSHKRVARELRKRLPKGTPLVVVSMGQPYALDELDADVKVAAFGFRGPSSWAAAQVLKGEVAASGRLPIALGDLPVGHGLLTDGSALPPPDLLSTTP